MKRRKIVIGNWKMNPETRQEAEKWVKNTAKLLPKIQKTDIIVCPPFLYIEKLKKISRKVSIGAQNAFWGDIGAHTGEVSVEMLYDLGVRYVILGHSERRAMGETDVLINKKIKAALSAGLTPIVCIGEVARDDGHEYFNVVKTQIKECLKGISKNLISNIIVAYEPVWAISSTPNRRDAAPADCLEMSIFIKKVLSDLSSPQIAGETRIIYG
ncbi:MAG: triose-phosphate isomerase, partial [Patescibacteria group bacterium]